MIEILEKTECCGCEACAQICPKDCIEMIQDKEGFFYPVVDKVKCINCGLCNKVCPIINSMYKNELLATYIARNNNEEIRMNSSSGGIFAELAKEILIDRGIVFGAGFTSKHMVQHFGIDNSEQIFKLQGSKYVQSRIINAYSETKYALMRGYKVLFSGTPCQIAGLRGYLGKDYRNLYTIDILCHGVPSPKLWERYLDEHKVSYQAELKSVSFRNKKYGWKSFSVLFEFDNNMEYQKIFSEDAYMRMFLQNICLRPSCHACKFKDIERDSDITLGDCWGIEKFRPEMDDNKGTSIVMIHTEKGKELLERIRDKISIEIAKIDEVLPDTADSRQSVKPHIKRDEFFYMLDRNFSFERMSNMVRPTLLKKTKNMIKKILRKILI